MKRRAERRRHENTLQNLLASVPYTKTIKSKRLHQRSSYRETRGTSQLQVGAHQPVCTTQNNFTWPAAFPLLKLLFYTIHLIFLFFFFISLHKARGSVHECVQRCAMISSLTPQVNQCRQTDTARPPHTFTYSRKRILDYIPFVFR